MDTIYKNKNSILRHEFAKTLARNNFTHFVTVMPSIDFNGCLSNQFADQTKIGDIKRFLYRLSCRASAICGSQLDYVGFIETETKHRNPAEVHCHALVKVPLKAQLWFGEGTALPILRKVMQNNRCDLHIQYIDEPIIACGYAAKQILENENEIILHLRDSIRR